ncbi:YbaB/EbfC family DNA-binding protein [Amycolatopsis sp. BJA-103]|uniref:YbaB/EbfC family DNA-binding protein n=1 Tax=unclassified Amycolatopsis TaxID=2618356 RepID=UPI000CA395C5|nr:YbaB/EbfC family DNA-binding protein [Amycolatopsis sp. BJA-103]AUI60349.1 hypothetical protein BKN51_20560 [Amycolatopsis sp. BJA-103]PNE16374.1 hypothetical protein B1H26_24175 [Amycolatopsis sp. BJA-103]
MTWPDSSDLNEMRRMKDEALAALERQRETAKETSRVWREETTTVTAEDRSMSMTFDGRGELTGITFTGSKYRSMAPAQLASVIVDMVRKGRAESTAKLTAHAPAVPGLDLDGLINGTADPADVLDKILGPMLDGMDNLSPENMRNWFSDDTRKDSRDG